MLIVGAGMTGSEVASACRARGLAVTMVEWNAAPLMSVLGAFLGHWAASRQLDAGVDLRCGISVTRLLGDRARRVVGASLSDGTEVAANLVVVALGAVRNCEWLDGSDLVAGPAGCACDSGCRALDISGESRRTYLCAAMSPGFVIPCRTGNGPRWSIGALAIDHAAIVAANVMRPGSATNDASLPRFWSSQFGLSIKASGLPSCADEVMVAQGSLQSGRFIALYGRKGRTIGVVAVNHAKWLPFYEDQIMSRSAFPLSFLLVDQAADSRPNRPGFPSLRAPVATLQSPILAK